MIKKTDYYKNLEVRGTWLATVFNIDWPSVKCNVDKQKEEFIKILDKVKYQCINTVLVQIRPKADAFYISKINPWSKYLTGEEGKYPGYDPLKFIIQECHKRDIKVYGWLNPFRVTTKGENINDLCDKHIAKLNPSWLLNYEDAFFFNPKNRNVIEYIQKSILEIIQNYNIDGICFDDYFYPYGYPLPKGEDRDGLIGNKRRDAITNLVRESYRTIKTINPSIEFGLSPSGIWKNKSSDKCGSDTMGSESYYSVYADSIKWIKEGILDFISPQIYYKIGQKNSDYEVLVRWWDKIVDNTKVSLYISHGIYKKDILQEINEQININRKYRNIKGSIFFSTKNILLN